jgi:hypothetical protein
MNAFSFSVVSAHRHCEELRGAAGNGWPDDKLRDKAIQKLLESKLKKRWAKAVDRNGYLFFRTNHGVKGAFGAAPRLCP